MAVSRRILFFLITNIAVVTMIGIVTNLLGVPSFMESKGINYEYLLIFSAIWGFGGAFISLLMSKFMAKTMMRVRVIDPTTADNMERQLVSAVHDMAYKAGLKKMPEVGVYDSPEVNAFATGPSRSNSLVAVSTGLLNRMDRDSVEGVLGHEVAHIANGDMVTMTLLQGIVNAFVIFLSRLLANFLSKDEEGNSSFGAYFALTIVFDILFGVLGSIVVNYYSRRREYRADEGGAHLAGKHKMIHALKSLARSHELVDNQEKAFASMKISGKSGLAALFSTHPSLESRISKLDKIPSL